MIHIMIQSLVPMRRLRNQWTLTEAATTASAYRGDAVVTVSVSASSVCADGSSGDGAGVGNGDVDDTDQSHG